MTKEQTLENKLIDKLKELKYTYRPDIQNREALEKNFREKFESLNKVQLKDSEFARLVDDILTPNVFLASQRLRQMNTFIRDDGTSLDYTLLNIKDWCKNEFEVIHQLKMNTQKSHHRYDVILLINGLPLVQIELKTLEISPRRAIQQIVDYKNDLGNGYTNSLLCFMQLFIVSNYSNTYYFANNNLEHFQFGADEKFLPIYQFADEKNKKITNLDDFAEHFLTKCKLAEMISQYMVLVQTQEKLLIMRPYQIYAVQSILNCVKENRGNGYIWHTTGSGKTLTSFKASTLLKQNPEIEKCLFVVDRKDLDRQTREEFNKFQKDCVEENTNTKALVDRLVSKDYANKVIVTTIQKLGLALDDKNKKNYIKQLQPLRNQRLVIIFDECHRSQFGENRKAIEEFFPHAQLFGFTGTPIFEENATYKRYDGTTGSYVTTKDIFQKELHAYTITHAIEDKNVLRFHVDYFQHQKDLSFQSKEHKLAVVNHILEKHDQATSNRKFNALFATASINDAIEYYKLFQTIQEEKAKQDENFQPLNITCLFTPPAFGNQDIKQLQEDLLQEREDNQINPEEKRLALESIISDYNQKFGTNFSLELFDAYYQDVQKRIKDHEYPNQDYPHKNKLDITIVVDMLLTGFDSKYLNTLYLDKNLKHHGLIQAMSRTNRVLNDTKPYGNILDYRNQKAEVDEAIVLFSGESPEEAKEIWLVEPAPVVIEKYEKAVNNVKKWLEAFELSFAPNEVYNLAGDSNKAEFINRFKEVQRIRHSLDQYTDLTAEQKTKVEELLPYDTFRGFKAAYLDLAKELQNRSQEETTTKEVKETDYELYLFASDLIDYDYIMRLIAEYTEQKPKKEKITREQLTSILRSHSNLMEESEDLIDYVNTLKVGVPLTEEQVREGYQTFKSEKFERELQEISQKHNLEITALKRFVEQTLSRMVFDSENLSALLENQPLGWKERIHKKNELAKELKPLLRKGARGREISGLT